MSIATIGYRLHSAIKSHFMSSASLHSIGYGTHPRMDYASWVKAIQSNAMNLGDYRRERKSGELTTKNSLVNELVLPEGYYPKKEYKNWLAKAPDKFKKLGWVFIKGQTIRM